MTDPDQIPHLLKLLTDESATIRQTVTGELASYGHELEDHIRNLALPLDDEQKSLLEPVLMDHRRIWLKSVWPRVAAMPDSPAKLELAYQYLANFQLGRNDSINVSARLDSLADDYLANHDDSRSTDLSAFLFETKKITGAASDYYNPLNSNLVYVIEHRSGIPITLVNLYMLVGHRLGLSIHGCNFPGHFLARASNNDQWHLVDCFNGGKFIPEAQFIEAYSDHYPDISAIVRSETPISTNISRVLRNLIRAYDQKKEQRSANTILRILETMQIDLVEESPLTKAEGGNSKPLFRKGDLVAHRRYGYRGVVVDVDTDCLADDLWYQTNHSQPRRDQPWYHVLVDQQTHTTYAAESNLVADTVQDKIHHPLIPRYFSGFENGHYVRNEIPWGT